MNNEEEHDINCECNDCLEQHYIDGFDELPCNGCGWCTDCFEYYQSNV